MSDDKSKTGKADRDRINLSEDYEVRDWSKKFGVSEDQLRKAVAKGVRNPFVLKDLVGIAQKNVTLDTEFSIQELVDLGMQFKDFDPDQLVTYTPEADGALAALFLFTHAQRHALKLPQHYNRAAVLGQLEHGAVRGVTGVYICDTSIFPSPTAVNPQATCMAMADVLTRQIAARA